MIHNGLAASVNPTWVAASAAPATDPHSATQCSHRLDDWSR